MKSTILKRFMQT